MLEFDQSEQVLDGEVLDAEVSACVDLVPLAQPVRQTARLAIVRPDPTFVTHLIATAAQAPQTCTLRRGSPADAQSAYGASQTRRYGIGFRTRQVI
jgi:hypothetical protein